jgi:hypothetical protein
MSSWWTHNYGLSLLLRRALRPKSRCTSAPYRHENRAGRRWGAHFVAPRLTVISFGLWQVLRLGLRVADGLGQHLAQLGLRFRRFPRLTLAMTCSRTGVAKPSPIALWIIRPVLSATPARARSYLERSRRRGRCESWAPHLTRRPCDAVGPYEHRRGSFQE